ncbi:MAG: NFACT RNA binding domain-containing protein, partial [Acetobacteraceae bacterium]|nr:NFACT RNA binding domain-containing protein [Acetobacteraceae bacterium]
QGPAGPPAASEPLRLVSADGLAILVGRNHRQNEQITLREAGPDDVWLHARGVPGSHVILRTLPDGSFPESSLLEAAALAAYFSRARASGKVEVDWTRRRHVRKPPGSRPGMVIYDHQRTVVVRPWGPMDGGGRGAPARQGE